MTKQEHALMIGLFAQTLEVVQALAQVLESRELMTQDDLHAFLAIRSPSEKSAMYEKARLIYDSIAKKAGIDIREVGTAP
jgi:hypothetical protein